MRSELAVRFVARGVAVALAAGALVALLAWPLAASAPWAALGWGLSAGLGLASGAWLAVLHGTPGKGFLIAMGVGLLSRLTLLTAGAVAAAATSGNAVGSYGLGLSVGFLAMLGYEAAWFLIADRRGAWTEEAIDG